MDDKSKLNNLLTLLIILLVSMAGLFVTILVHQQSVKSTPIPSVPLPARVIAPDQKQYNAALDVARVFGRSQGCAEADAKLIGDVATEALRSGIEPRILAATVAVESSCDSMAVSHRGAIGLTQVMPKIWKASFDFEHSINLFNPNDNLHAGATILGGLIKQYGVAEGVRHYQGTGTDCSSCDDNYVPKILALAGRH